MAGQKTITITSGGGISSPLTTKGDIWVYGTADTRLPAGTNGYYLVTDSAEPTGLKWVAASGGSLEDARLIGNTFAGDVDYDGNNIVDINGIGFNLGQQVTWNSDYKTLNVPTGEGATLQVGQELYYRIHNNTGIPITNGQVVQPQGTILVGSETIPTVILAKADNLDTCNGLLLVATHDIANGAEGMATRFGRVSGLDTSSWTTGGVYLSDTVAGELTNTRPEFPSYIIPMGGLLKLDPTDGIIGIEVGGGVQDTVLNAWVGSFRETFDLTISSDGVTTTASLEQSGGGDLTMIFSDGLDILDCTPPATIALVAGLDTLPQENFIYILQSTKALGASTSGWPAAEHIKVANVYLRSDATTQTDDALVNRNWNDHIAYTGDNGHLSHITERLRQNDAAWDTGAEGTCTVSSPTASDVYLSNTSGYVYQLHKQTFPALDMSTGDIAHIVNHFTTPYFDTTNLNTETSDALGNTLANKSFSFVVWGVANKGGETSHVMVNLPTGSYSKNSPDTAVEDASNYSVYTIPRQFRGVGFLIARYTFTLAINGLDWVLYDTEDLRGKIPNTSAGGGVGGGGVTTFTALIDTPSSYLGEALKVPQINVGENALEFAFVDHVNLLNIGSNTHAQLDTHVADATLHFTEASIDHTAISNIGTNTHAQIDTHIATLSGNPHNVEEQEVIGERLTNAAVTGSTSIDWDAYKVFEFTLTGNTTITDSNLPTGTETKVIEMVVTGDFTLTFPAYYEALPSNDTYDGTKRNHIVISCINGTGSSEDVIYSLQTLTT